MPEDGWITYDEWIESFDVISSSEGGEEWTEEDERAVQKAVDWINQKIAEHREGQTERQGE